MTVNPLRDPRDRRIPRLAGPCVLVLFGVTGDLASKKLLPAIYDLANRGLAAARFLAGRVRPAGLGDADFAQITHDAVKAHARTPFREEVWRQLAEGIRFVPGEFADDAAFDRLAETVAELDRDQGTGGNYAFYLSVPPNAFPTVVRQLQALWPVESARNARGHAPAMAPGRDREAVRPRPRERAGTQRDAGRGVPGVPRSSGSTTTWARRRSRTCWRCGSPTRCSSRSGTAGTSTTSRSRWPRTSASAAGPATTTASARPGT